MPSPLAFTKIARHEFLDTKAYGPLYAFHWMGGSHTFGWVARHTASGEWHGWNSHGDFWSSFGQTRQSAAEALMEAPWRFFTRRPVDPATLTIHAAIERAIKEGVDARDTIEEIVEESLDELFE